MQSMLLKGVVIPKPGQFRRKLSVVPKFDTKYRPIINPKKLNNFVPYAHLKIEGLMDVMNIQKEGDWMCRLDLKDDYFLVPLKAKSRKLARRT